MYSALELTDNKSEIIQYNVPNLPIKASHFSQEDYPSLSIVNHWRTEFEFIYVKNAPMWYSVNGEQCKLLPGQMIFVNSGQMHYGYWEKSSNWVYDCVLFPPTLATNPVTKDLLDAVIHHAPPYLSCTLKSPRKRRLSPMSANCFSVHLFSRRDTRCCCSAASTASVTPCGI